MENKSGKKPESNQEQKTETPKTSKAVERIAISNRVTERVDRWMSQIEKQAKAVRITRADVTNFILLSHSEDLSAEEIAALNKTHFDEVKFSFWLARTLKKAKQKGESVSLDDLYREYGLLQD